MCLSLLINTIGPMGGGDDLLLNSTEKSSETVTEAVSVLPKYKLYSVRREALLRHYINSFSNKRNALNITVSKYYIKNLWFESIR